MAYDFVGMVALDKGRSALKKLVADLERRKPDWNEAETLFQFIDPFLTKCSQNGIEWGRYRMA